ncbi:MAG: hypothetical protein VB030_03415 [Eubacterium aggregans]|jgi:hypothetical protein|uniref:hypothetical protein n=1 Tax=Eubacterium aggregans TaxID=81409 RepID=UPI002B20FCBC|nr:hypothetical protein [Eubacterium aggregans]MEA5073201.1 hypothetical protein [Eubacterium aggregans]
MTKAAKGRRFLREESKDGIVNKKQKDHTYRGVLQEIKLQSIENSRGAPICQYVFVIRQKWRLNTFIFKGVLEHDLRQFFSPGDRVTHYKGFPIPVKRGSIGPLTVCMDCGQLVKSSAHSCPYCGCVIHLEG